MALRELKPTTPGQRGMTQIAYREVLTRSKPEKSLTRSVQRAVGRNNVGRITTRHKGGGVKRKYRAVAFDYTKKDIPARIVSIEYDPNRTSFISLLMYADGMREYRLSPKGLRPGETVLISAKSAVKPGNALPIGEMPSGTAVFNIELKPGAGGKIARSAGNTAEIMSHEKGMTMVKLPSKEVRNIPSAAWATVGTTHPEEHRFVNFGKAGRSRRKGIRPTVRGSAMNPVDHPYGGGEGRSPQGTKRPKNLWGKGTRGVKTRNRKKYSRLFIIERRPKTVRK